MKKYVLLSFFISNLSLFAQTSVGIGIYPTGTETGIGFRSSRTAKWIADVRLTKANFYDNKTMSSVISEASAVCRVVRLEKLRFHVGMGLRTEWNFGGKNNKVGGVIPIGVEAFPFPFQNAGLFFEAAPFYTSDLETHFYAGLRTVAGFVFYFPSSPKQEELKTN